jgi:hypothetical protein
LGGVAEIKATEEITSLREEDRRQGDHFFQPPQSYFNARCNPSFQDKIREDLFIGIHWGPGDPPCDLLQPPHDSAFIDLPLRAT